MLYKQLFCRQRFAEQVDSKVLQEIHDKGTRDFVEDFLNQRNFATIEEAMHAIASAADSTPSKKYLLVASQIIFRYSLLDIFCDVLDCPKSAGFTEVPRMRRPSSNVVMLWKVNFFIILILYLTLFVVLH
jgi:hypothetical protein